MMGRILEEEGWESDQSYLSAARIRDRAFNFSKTETGCEFETTRHPGAWNTVGTSKRVVQRWSLDFVEKTMALLGTREFDPERDVDS